MMQFGIARGEPLPAGAELLLELARDLRWSWNHAADALWQQLDPPAWELTHSPWAVLQTLSRSAIETALANASFRAQLDSLLTAKRVAATSPAWFQKAHANSELKCVAYFSMEYMLSEALPIYSGGLGNVAGDQLKAASDLGVPIVAVGLLYQQGYFRQTIDADGWQQALFPYNDPSQLPIAPVRAADGQWLRLEVVMPGYSIWLRAWQVEVGRCKLYLLDSNDTANPPAHRAITSSLYGGGPELRLRQEMVLGIGGWRLLRALGLQPDVCHLNEGHAAFAILERAREFMLTSKQPFDVALTATRAGNLFTTHTAVPAGFDRFSPALVAQHLTRYASTLQISIHDFLALGRADPNDDAEPFNMAYLAIRGSGAINGVSRLHGQVSRRLFAPIFPRWPEAEVPVGHVTNGVHAPSWDSAPADALWTRACGKDRWLGSSQDAAAQIRDVSDEDVWRTRNDCRRALVAYARERLRKQLALECASPTAIARAGGMFDPNVLTLGFARRFATYKRPDLLLRDPDRLLQLLSNSNRPVQLLIAGKAHPGDDAGREMIRRWIDFIRHTEARAHVMFLSDYDMLLAEQLVQGVDVWINTPRRPWEASGTSGMKVLVNGGLNLSELDGWWAEAYAPEVGWAIGDGQEHGDDPSWDAIEANQLYDALEREVVPAFYDRGSNGIPGPWVARVRESMAQLTPRFSADRAVREYIETYYLPAARAAHARTADGGAMAADLVRMAQLLRERWPAIGFGEVRWTSADGHHRVEADVRLGGVDPADVAVEAYADQAGEAAMVRQPARRLETSGAASGTYRYVATVPADRPIADFTLRLVPVHPSAALPLELPLISWQR